MNWFQRYSIPGGYFIFLVGIFLSLNYKDFNIKINDLNNYTTIIGGFIAVSFLPLGYLFVIIGQLIYYKTLKYNFLHYHKHAWKDNKLFNDPNAENNELLVETKILVWSRIKDPYTESHSFDKVKWLHEYYSKRIDVLAINTANMISTSLLIILDIIVMIFYSHPEFICRNLILLFFLIFLVFIYKLSYSNIKKQIYYIDNEYFKNITEEVKNMPDTITPKQTDSSINK